MKNEFVTLKEFLVSGYGERTGKTEIDPVILTGILLESISSKDFAKALAKLSSASGVPFT